MPDGVGRAPGAAGRPPEMPKGLLPPVRGARPAAGPAAGRGAVGAPGAATPPGPGVGPGRGPAGRAACVPRAAAARTAASCSAFNAAARCSAAATSMSCALVGRRFGGGAGTGPPFFAGALVVSPVLVRGGVGFADVAPRVPLVGAPVTAGAAGRAPVASMLARSRRATGGSTVLDADLTYSPISCSLARTILLSTPSSLASSCTRGLPATTLLIPRSAGAVPLDLTSALERCSWLRVHRVLMSVVSYLAIREAVATVGLSCRPSAAGHMGREHAGVQDPGYAQRPGETSAPLRLGETGRVIMQVRSPPRKAVPGVDGQGSNPAIDHRDDA